MDLLFNYAHKFFALPMEKKTAISIHKSPSYNGYIEPGTKYIIPWKNVPLLNFKVAYSVCHELVVHHWHFLNFVGNPREFIIIFIVISDSQPGK